MFRCLISVFLLLGILTSCMQESAEKTPEYRPEVLNAKWMNGKFNPDSGEFFLVGEQGSIAVSKDGSLWNYANTPSLHTLKDIAIDSKQNTAIAVGENGTILRSSDGGKNWLTVTLELPEGTDFSSVNLNKVIYAPASKTWLAAGQKNAILFSSDQGLNWKLVSYNDSESQLEILDLFIEKNTNDILFAAQYANTGRSNDGGLNWEISSHEMEAVGSYLPHVVGFHQYGDTLIAAADEGRLLVSKDKGITWRLVKLGTAGYFTDSAYDPLHKSIVLTTQEGEVAVSQDAGETWNLVFFQVENWPSDDIPLLSNIVYDEKTQSFLLVGNSGITARSADGGLSWFADVFKPLFNLSVTTLLHNPEKNIFVSAGLGGAIAKSNGLSAPSEVTQNWELVRPGIDQYMRHVVNLPDSNTFVAVGQLGGIWRSQDDGVSWQLIEPDYPFKNQPPHLRDIVQDPASKALISAGPAGSIVRSTDTGNTWTPVFQGRIHEGEAFTQILWDEKRKTYLACEVLYQRIYRSKDAGVSWEKVAQIESDKRNLWHGAVSEKLDVIMLVGQRGGIGISHDGGDSWSMADSKNFSDLYGAFSDEKSGVLLAVGHNGVVLRSTDGDNWKTMDSKTASTLRRVVKDPRSNAYIAFGQDGAIIRSEDLGLTWKAIAAPIASGELRQALIEPKTNNIILVGRDGVVLRTTDSGLTWNEIPSHTSRHFRSAAANPVTGTVIVIGDGLVRLSATHD